MKRLLLLLLLLPFGLFAQYYPVVRVIYFEPATLNSTPVVPEGWVHITDSTVCYVDAKGESVIYEGSLTIPEGNATFRGEYRGNEVCVRRDGDLCKFWIKYPSYHAYFWTTVEPDLSK